MSCEDETLVSQSVSNTSQNVDNTPVDKASQSSATMGTQQSEKAKRKVVSLRSMVWDHFKRFRNEADNEWKGRCNYCAKEFYCDPKRNGTTALKNHISVCRKHPIDENGEKQSFINFKMDDNSIGCWKFDQEAIRKAITYMIIVDELPFKFVDGMGFRRLMSIAQPKFRMSSRWTVARDCFQIYIDEKTRLKEYLSSRKQMICLTTDTWTSIQRLSYMCLTAHFIDDEWKLNKKILNFIPISSHRGKDIGIELEKCLLDWGINRVFTITVDNASSNDVAVNYMREKIINWGFSIMKCKYLHMRCVAHIINLIVNDGLKEIGVSVKKVRDAIRFVRGSTTRMKKFKEACELEKVESKQLLSLDVSTRWNSTYLMLETAQKFEGAFRRFEDLDPFFRIDLESDDGVPETTDWVNVRKMMTFLSHFYKLTLRISGSLYVTSNLFFREIYMVYRVLDAWTKRDDDEDLHVIAKRMKEKYDKYWGDPSKMNYLIYIACVLDPRYKLQWVKLAFSKMYGNDVGEVMGNKAKEILISIYNEYNEIVSPTSQQMETSSQCSQSVLTTDDEMIDDPAMMVQKLVEFEMQSLHYEILGGVTGKTDVDRYLDETIELPKADFDILQWWKLNNARFPILSKVARDVLAIPISTVASESTFSTGGRILDAYRSSLTPKCVQSLICAQDWLRHSLPLTLEENEDDAGKMEKEFQSISLESTVDVL